MPRLATLALLGLTCCSRPEARLDVPYDERFGASTTMDIYLPEGGGGRRPAVMLVHGGGWRMGSKEHYTKQAERLAEAGYVAATINYRLVPEGSYPHAMQDCFCALAFLRAHADDLGLDPDRVAVMGYSAGGHLVGVLGLAANEPDFAPDCAAGATGPANAVIAGAGPMDLRWRQSGIVEDFLGGTVDEVPERYDAASPITHVRPGAPPFLFVHAEDDWFVDIAQSRITRDLLLAEGNDARLLSLRGAGHIFTAGADLGTWYGEMATDTPEAWAAIIDFLDRTVGGAP